MPMYYHIQLALLMFKAYVGQCPLYVRDAVMLMSQNTCRYHLHSANTICSTYESKVPGESILCCWTDCLELFL